MNEWDKYADKSIYGKNIYAPLIKKDDNIIIYVLLKATKPLDKTYKEHWEAIPYRLFGPDGIFNSYDKEGIEYFLNNGYTDKNFAQDKCNRLNEKDSIS